MIPRLTGTDSAPVRTRTRPTPATEVRVSTSTTRHGPEGARGTCAQGGGSEGTVGTWYSETRHQKGPSPGTTPGTPDGSVTTARVGHGGHDCPATILLDTPPRRPFRTRNRTSSGTPPPLRYSNIHPVRTNSKRMEPV